MVPEMLLSPDATAIRRDLTYMTSRWDELPVPALFEIRAFKEGAQPQTFKYAPDWIDDAVNCVEKMNGLGYNIYAVRNAIRADMGGGKSASDADIIASFFLWADCDEPTSAENVRRWEGPKYSAAVTTGQTPAIRVHTYWQLEQPCTDMALWRDTQAAIAAHFGSDRTVINPSRIMRVGGTVSYPAKHKVSRGYVQELTKVRTEYPDARMPVTLDQMRRAFGATAPAQQPPLSPTGFEIDTGAQAMDREAARIKALSGDQWNIEVFRLVGSYVRKGLSDAEIHAITDGLTLNGYTVTDTRAEVQAMINRTRANPNFIPEEPEAAHTFGFDGGADAPGGDTDGAADGQGVTWPTEYAFFDEAALQPRQWVYGKHYLRSFVSVLASAGGIGKTSLQIVEALAICTGRPLLGEEVAEQCNVWIINLEDPMEEMQRRILAAMRLYNIKPEDVAGRLFVDAGRDFNITFAAQTRAGITPNVALVAHLIKRIPELKIGAVFIDPFVASHQINENDNMAVNAVIGQIRTVADKTNCAIGLVHHIRKSNGEDANIDSVRGAGSLIGAARAARIINRVTEEDALKLGVNQKDATGIFRVDDGKANMAPPASVAVFRRMEGVQIANGEWIGVATEYRFPDEWRGMTDSAVNDILRIIELGIPDNEGNEEYYSKRHEDAGRWAGSAITQYAFDRDEDMKTEADAKRIIAQWLKSGLLEEFSYRSVKQRKDRKAVRPTGRVGAER